MPCQKCSPAQTQKLFCSFCVLEQPQGDFSTWGSQSYLWGTQNVLPTCCLGFLGNSEGKFCLAVLDPYRNLLRRISLCSGSPNSSFLSISADFRAACSDLSASSSHKAAAGAQSREDLNLLCLLLIWLNKINKLIIYLFK